MKLNVAGHIPILFTLIRVHNHINLFIGYYMFELLLGLLVVFVLKHPFHILSNRSYDTLVYHTTFPLFTGFANIQMKTKDRKWH